MPHMPHKTCFKCERFLSINDFYSHPRMADKHLNKCKECTRKDANERRTRKRVLISQYEYKRNQDPARKKRKMEYQRIHRVVNPQKLKARRAVSQGIRSGVLQRQPCQYCGSTKTQAHHEDYDKPLDVIWVCFKCHREQCHGQVVVSEGFPF